MPMRFAFATTLLIALSGCGSQQPSRDNAILNAEPMESALQTECREYLQKGPPEHMENYVPESLTEVLISHGATGEAIDPELAEIGAIILMESESLFEIDDPDIRGYMQKGVELVKRVLETIE